MISEKLKRLRISKELTQSELSEISGVSNIQIGRYESGSSKPNEKTLLKLANALEVDLEYFTMENPLQDNTYLEERIDLLKGVITEEEDRRTLIALIDSFYLRCVAKSKIA